MTNEEITKDLTVALINKMANPTIDSISNSYNEILQKIGKSDQTTKLQTIEDLLRKQDRDFIDNARDTGLLSLIAFAGSIAVSGVTILFNQVANYGWWLIGYGFLILVLLWILSTILRKRRQQNLLLSKR